jgi:hypothetical protein
MALVALAACGAGHRFGVGVKGPGGTAVELSWTIDPDKAPDPPPDPWPVVEDK